MFMLAAVLFIQPVQLPTYTAKEVVPVVVQVQMPKPGPVHEMWTPTVQPINHVGTKLQKRTVKVAKR